MKDLARFIADSSVARQVSKAQNDNKKVFALLDNVRFAKIDRMTERGNGGIFRIFQFSFLFRFDFSGVYAIIKYDFASGCGKYNETQRNAFERLYHRFSESPG